MSTTNRIFPEQNPENKAIEISSDYAARLATLHNWLGLKKKGKSLLPGVRKQSLLIQKAYSQINSYYYKTEDIIPAAEWYLDNFYLINELIKELIKDLSKQVESKLMYLAGGDLAGSPRIYLLISEYVKLNENQLDFLELQSFVTGYQTEAPLSSAEIWAIPIMLKVIMLERIFYQVERILFIQNERQAAENWLNGVLGKTDGSKPSRPEPDSAQDISTVFIEFIARKLKEHGTEAKLLLNWLDNTAGKQNLTVEKVISSENYYLTSLGVQMGNIIAALKMINSENWSAFFEGVSLVQQILEDDPAQVFMRMDFESRDKYRHEIESLAGKFNVSEIIVAKAAHKLALASQESPLNHIGYYLLGQGKILLEQELAGRWGRVRKSFHSFYCFYKKRPALTYLGVILAATLLPYFFYLGAILDFSYGSTSWTIDILLIICSLILINSSAVYLVNRAFCQVLPASFLPKLDFGSGIPDECKTAVVVPAIFDSAEKVREQLKQLEIHYLCNQDKNLKFVILGDFKDASGETMPEDQKIILAGIKGIQKLNRKYGRQQFYYLHRARKWNEQEKIWMGWERKRGKLIEFNSLLLQDGETGYIVTAGNMDMLRNVSYVITLDADTILPRDSARRLVGTIAHPMQKARLDFAQKKVLSGYGIIQPRIGITAKSAYATPFSTIFTGTAGLDPYTCAISDIYQDLFAEGIYTGKGIYDLQVFHVLTKDAFPENTILSHDLLEGLHARTALATDIELFDGYPTKYLALAKRTHRWIRGDWQIAKYIFSNKLSVISRWKILDNLRRSVEAPVQLLLIFLAFILPPKLFWLLTGLVLFNYLLPLLLNIGSRILDRSLTFRILKHELRLGLYQSLFSIAILPYQGYLQTDAIFRSLFRQLVSKRSLLEWVPAADAEKELQLTSKNFYVKMAPGIILSLFFLPGFLHVESWKAVSLFILMAVWLLSPAVACRLSLPYRGLSGNISPEKALELRKWSRQVWAYFDLLVNEENHYLPPDNIQIEPYTGIAQRTSPTNIGLALLAFLAAEDFGYLSKKTMLEKIRRTLAGIRSLPKWHGHIYNWYNIRSMEPLLPIYISTVDSGNLATYLIALKNGLQEFAKRQPLEKSMLAGLLDTALLIGEMQEEKLPDEVQNNLQKFILGLQALLEDEKGPDLKLVYDFLREWLTTFANLHYEQTGIFEQISPENTKDRKFQPNGSVFWFSSLVRMLREYHQAIEHYYPFVDFPDQPQFLQDLTKLNTRSLIKGYLALLRKTKGGGARALPGQLKARLKKGLKNTALTLLWAGELQKEIKTLAYGMDFQPLFDAQKKLFSIGYNLSEQKLDKSYYDLLASEARQSSLFAIAKGDVPESHWFKMARPLTRINGNRCLVAWSGTMFEFLMPLILFKRYRGTLLEETYRSVVRIQRAYAGGRQKPWGISESGFFSFDLHSNYQYKAFGVPGLGLKRGLSKDLVISPYSTFMALAVDFEKSMDNLLLMKGNGFNGTFGLYEAIDFTKSRVPYKQEFSLVKSYMSHHQGMSLIAINNVLTGDKMQERFHREPVIRSVELLLQEQVPLKEYTFNPIIEENGTEKIPGISRKNGEKPVVYVSPDTRMPRTNFLSNQEYTVMLTLSGSGYSQYNGLMVTRWREDPTLDLYGTFIYIQNLNSGHVWSATSKPYNETGREYKVTCFPNTIKYSRKDGNIITQTEVFVAPLDPVEIRKISLTNLSQHSRDMQLTSYGEIVLDYQSADLAHPAFSKLFIKTSFENNILIASRRPREYWNKELFALHTLFGETEMLGEIEYESDRLKFIGRGRTLANPRALDYNQPLSNTVGAVIDPIISLRGRVRIGPAQTVVLYFLTGIGESKEDVLRLAQKYRSAYAVNQARALSWSQNLMELTNLGLSFSEANMISSLAGQVVFPGLARKNINIRNNKRGQSSLWAYGISGDLPVVLLKIQDQNQLKLVDQMMKIHEYWKIKGFYIDLVIVNEDRTGYFQTIQERIQEIISVSHVRKLVNKPGGVFLLKKDQLPKEIIILLHTVARITFSGVNGSLYNQIQRFNRLAEQYINFDTPGRNGEDRDYPNPIETGGKTGQWGQLYLPGNSYLQDKAKTAIQSDLRFSGSDDDLKLLFYNGFGGFSADGKEYVVKLSGEQNTPLPWVNVLANPHFGTLVTEAGAGYTWSQNSREYKLTPWSNDPVLDTGGEALYLREEKTGCYWSPVPQPARGKEPYLIRHGQGYTIYEHSSNGLDQRTTVFVPLNENIKIVSLKLRNSSSSERELSVYYYLEWVLGVNREHSIPYMVTELNNEILCCRNVYQEEFKGRVAFLCSFGGHFQSFTTDRREFIGINRSLKEPFALEAGNLTGISGNVADPCGVIQIGIHLQPQEEKTVYFLIGDAENEELALDLAGSFRDEQRLSKSLQQVQDFWENLLSTIQISTPEKSLDLLFNRWLIYQTLVCRIWARSAFYQAGGAFGFRDQLQDVMALTILKPELSRQQILLHSSRQFKEGDVQHWWHSETGKGIRTRFSDDLLWLPYVASDYIAHTGDRSILEEKTPFLEQETLEDGEYERYAIPEVSGREASVYEHCVRAIDYSLKFGEHGLPLIGTGDWNDGFSAVGKEGKGESVWLGWFLLTVLQNFIPLCEQQGDQLRAEKYRKIIGELSENMEENAWDGSWYRRAYYDDGSPLGSITNQECRIDSLAQSWAVISGKAGTGRASDAMMAMERYLWDKEEGIFKLFTPPLDKTAKNPGYIKGYIPGVRENGGQYTHGAIWAVWALTRLGERNKALELFNTLNPVNHARTNNEVAKYKAEPYVMAADVYTVIPNVGRGGWSWYTGAAGWMYQVALEGILGVRISGNHLTIEPCVPESWKEFQLVYRYKSASYHIQVNFAAGPEKAMDGQKQVIVVDGITQQGFPLVLQDDGKDHAVQLFL